MSSEKKIKGRISDTLLNDSLTDRLVRKFLQMHETDYARSVVIPVLEAEGYERVDFHHGPTEVGKDLIFTRNIGFGRKELIVAVVKTDRLSKSSSGPNGLPVIIVQAHQAITNQVISWDGSKRKPDSVFIILADDPSRDIIGSSPDGFLGSTERQCTYILGSDVANSLLEHRPDIAESLLESKLDTAVYLRQNATNIPLLHALNSNDCIDIETVFSELDASVGSTSMSQALTLRPSENGGIVLVTEPTSWPAARAAVERLQRLIGGCLHTPLSEIEKNYNNEKNLAGSESNKKVIARVTESIAEITGWALSVTTDLSGKALSLSGIDRKILKNEPDLIEPLEQLTAVAYRTTRVANDLKIRFAQLGYTPGSTPPSTVKDYFDVIERFSTDLRPLSVEVIEIESGLATAGLLKSTKNRQRLRVQNIGAMSEFCRLIQRELVNADDLVKKRDAVLSDATKVLPPPKYVIHFDIARLDNQIEATKARLLAKFQPGVSFPTEAHSRGALDEAKEFLGCMNEFISNSELKAVMKRSDCSEEDRTRNLGACVLGILNSGLDVLVTGNAGSGKSTTLDLFARRKYAENRNGQEVIFVPLAKIGNPSDPDQPIAALDHFCSEVARLFRTTQRGATSELVKQSVLQADKLVLVLDGIDEALGLVPWIVTLLKHLRTQDSRSVQLVASSRFVVPELEQSGLFNIQLRPFSRDQVVEFIKNYLHEDVDLADEVVSHLHRHPGMFSVARTPLMSTILCVLAKNGVVLPETKIALYKERFELLWGAYDAKKQVRRVNSSRSVLEDVSKKTAYFLHERELRSESKETIKEYVSRALLRRYRREVIELALDELERPCNILVTDWEEKLGFGHLTYQEYLAAEELYTNRQADIVVHLSKSWWREVLVLVAMRTEDIGDLIAEKVSQTGFVGGSAATLKAMVEVCAPTQKRVLGDLLTQHSRMDYWVDLDEHSMIDDSRY